MFSLIGIILSLSILTVAIGMSLSDYMVVFQMNALLVVIGGTFTASMTSFPPKELWKLIKAYLNHCTGKRKDQHHEVIEDVLKVATLFKQGPEALKAQAGNIKNPFLADSANLLDWIDSGIRQEDLRDILDTRVATFYGRYMAEARYFRAIAKFPPAFGLLGTTLGLVALLQALGGVDIKTFIGPAMAVALITTLWGIAIANFILIPISEHLSRQTDIDNLNRTLVSEGIMMIVQGKPIIYIREKLLSFILPSERGPNSTHAAQGHPNNTQGAA